jgi:CRP/FNR family transcriptional regulator, cyclic AMP receptor protein
VARLPRVAKDRAFLQMYRERIADIPLFSGLSDRELRSLAHRAEQVSVPTGTAVVTEGTNGVEFFVVMSGSAKVTRRGRMLTKLGPGDSFGELALLAGTPRRATVTTMEPTELMVLVRSDLVALLDDFPRMTRKMLTALATWVAERDD